MVNPEHLSETLHQLCPGQVCKSSFLPLVRLRNFHLQDLVLGVTLETAQSPPSKPHLCFANERDKMEDPNLMLRRKKENERKIWNRVSWLYTPPKGRLLKYGWSNQKQNSCSLFQNWNNRMLCCSGFVMRGKTEKCRCERFRVNSMSSLGILTILVLKELLSGNSTSVSIQESIVKDAWRESSQFCMPLPWYLSSRLICVSVFFLFFTWRVKQQLPEGQHFEV